MFPDKLIEDLGGECSTEIDVIAALRTEIPYFLNWLVSESADEAGEPTKFLVEEIEEIDIMTMDTRVDPIYDIDIWGVGLRVKMTSGKYFLVYMPMYFKSIFDEVFSYWFEIYNSIKLVDADTDVFTLPQMKVWNSNLFRYKEGEPTFVLTKAEVMAIQ